MGDIVPPIYNGDHLESDLDAIRSDPNTAADADLLSVFLDEVAGTKTAVWKLARWKDEHLSNPHFNCGAVACFQQQGYNIYRLRPLTGRLSKYRVVYAYDAPRDEFHLLAAVIKLPNPPPAQADPRHYNYEADHPISNRVRAEYDEYGFARI